MELKLGALMEIMPQCSGGADWVPALNSTFTKFGITDMISIASFLAEAAHESNELNRLEENLHYRADRVAAVFGTARFPNQAAIDRVCTNGSIDPIKLANYVYASRYGNGDEASGDGWRFRGGGIFQLTFADNYKAAGALMFDGNSQKLLDDPAYIRVTREGAALSAGAYWKMNKLQTYVKDFDLLTEHINKAKLGLEQRRMYFERAKTVLPRYA